MSKKLVSILLLSLAFSGCYFDKPKYRVGDCAQQIPTEECEKWEDCGAHTFKILEIGVEHYRTAFINRVSPSLGIMGVDQTIYGLDHRTEKVECPAALKDAR